QHFAAIVCLLCGNGFYCRDGIFFQDLPGASAGRRSFGLVRAGDDHRRIHRPVQFARPANLCLPLRGGVLRKRRVLTTRTVFAWQPGAADRAEHRTGWSDAVGWTVAGGAFLPCSKAELLLLGFRRVDDAWGSEYVPGPGN